MSWNDEALTLDKLTAMCRPIPRARPPLRFFPSLHMTIGPFEDWSDVRSPSRARRRRRQGHAQRIRFYRLPDPKLIQTAEGAVFGHPETLAKLRALIDERNKSRHSPDCVTGQRAQYIVTDELSCFRPPVL